MTKRDVVIAALNGEKVPYTPWQINFTIEAMEKLKEHFGDNIHKELGNHLCRSSVYPAHKDIGNDLHEDFFGVIWDRSEDKDIGIVKDCLLPEPNLDNYTFPSMDDIKKFQAVELKKIYTPESKKNQDFQSGFFIIRTRLDYARHGKLTDGLHY